MYKAILFAPDGEWVTWFSRCQTIEEVENNLENMGSLWFFYPFHFVITDNFGFTSSTQRIVSAPDGLKHLVGRAISTVSKHLATGAENYLLA